MHAKINSNTSMQDLVWYINDVLESESVTIDEIDAFLDTPTADALPNWAWHIINAVMCKSTDCGDRLMYKIEDTFGAPQCGLETTTCDTWDEVEAYFEDEDAMDRLSEGYARVIEL